MKGFRDNGRSSFSGYQEDFPDWSKWFNGLDPRGSIKICCTFLVSLIFKAIALKRSTISGYGHKLPYV